MVDAREKEAFAETARLGDLFGCGTKFQGEKKKLLLHEGVVRFCCLKKNSTLHSVCPIRVHAWNCP